MTVLYPFPHASVPCGRNQSLGQDAVKDITLSFGHARKNDEGRSQWSKKKNIFFRFYLFPVYTEDLVFSLAFHSFLARTMGKPKGLRQNQSTEKELRGVRREVEVRKGPTPSIVRVPCQRSKDTTKEV